MKQISIVIPIYNMEKYLERALESVVDQTIGIDRLEVIMVNDGSTDSSNLIIERYSKKYNNFIAINLDKASGSAGRPRNIGVQAATGKYIMFLDPDDYYSKTACSDLYSLITKYNSDVGIGNSLTHDGDYEFEHNYMNQMDSFEKHIFSVSEFRFVYYYSLVVWNAIYRRDFLMKNHIISPEGIVMQDSVFAISALFCANSIAITKSIITHHLPRKNGDKSITHRLTPHYFTSVGTAQKMIYDIFSQNDRAEDYIIYLIPIYEKLFQTKLLGATELNDVELMSAMRALNWFYALGLESGVITDKNPLSRNIALGNYADALVLLKLSRLKMLNS